MSLEVAKERENYHDRRAKMREFEVGDHVWASNFSLKVTNKL